MKITRMMYAVEVVGLVAASAIASTFPVHQVAAQAAVERASSAGAGRYASRELALARDKLEQARNAEAHGDGIAARRLAVESEADAMLAWALASTAKSTLAAEAMDQAVQALRQESGTGAKAAASQPFMQ